MQVLHAAAGNVRLDTTEALGVAPKDVEGAAFAWLAYRTLRGEAGNVPAVTGACATAPLGAIYPAAGEFSAPERT
jgi:anhydro-N-acetylmuramic acid kinase